MTRYNLFSTTLAAVLISMAPLSGLADTPGHIKVGDKDQTSSKLVKAKVVKPKVSKGELSVHSNKTTLVASAHRTKTRQIKAGAKTIEIPGNLGAKGKARAPMARKRVGKRYTSRLAIKKIKMLVGHSRLLKLSRRIKRVSVGEAKVADVVVITRRQVYINAKGHGTTNLTLWGRNDRVIGVVMIHVYQDLTTLKEQMHQILPGEVVEVRALGKGIVLTGRVSSVTAKKRAEAVAKAFAPKNVTNLLEVSKRQQVLLKVRFAEVNRNMLRRLNPGPVINKIGDFFFFSQLDDIVRLIPDKQGVKLNDFRYWLNLSSKMTAFGGFSSGSTSFSFFLDALKENGLARVLAEPNLVATSGKKASFLAGGEFPVPVPQDQNVTILFKKFGVQLNFIPEVTSSGLIRLKVKPEVSDLDFSIAVQIQGFVVPGLTTRTAQTELELKPGQSFAIAGLFRDEVVQAVKKFPLLGDIPILGVLFRSTSFQRRETELVIVVTPELVKPGTASIVKLPTDRYRVPKDWEIYLLGGLDGRELKKKPSQSPSSTRSGKPQVRSMQTRRSLRELEGEFGHGWSH